ncbi:hypothetical protein MASR2M117_19570 [Paludibacter sp.]
MKLKNFINFTSCKYCFTTEHHYDISYKSRAQKVICLGYFTPFKNDFRLENKAYEKSKLINNKCFDLYITTSKIASRIISVDTGISYYKFLHLGFPRNDNLLRADTSDQILDYLTKTLNKKIKKIIIYTPTFRNYEYKKTGLSVRNIFGYEDMDMEKLNVILEKHDAVIVAKLHPYQNKTIINRNLPDRVILSSDIEQFNLYTYLSISNFLISDYTSTYFDFLFLDRPIIFNFYDFQKYKLDRGFSFEPIEEFCAGDIVDSFNSMLDSIENNLNGIDNYNKKRKFVHNFINKYHDKNSSERIINYLFKQKTHETH